ncbi:DNA alkylation repair protein [Flavobacterium aciduliphilum]|uniref:DNA-7-methylguanine glycosylase n=1 Tax=Flavobacterium aciduliphilum TaxID=1101402 RepID=A0A328YMU4_9FLAO|nr:DNA alkylation repair protein [Flavobacterium aciduliphilum]RAR75381.1 DNA-7-methylguanine glycosylase [Flavobacterium aciduliphilum]
MNFINDLEQEMRQNSNREAAVPMENYMKNKFQFLGIKTEERRTIFKTNYEKHKAEIKAHFRTIAWELFNKKEREFHQCAIDLLVKEFKKNYVLDDIQFIEKLISTHSWWDSVDVVAKYLLGGYLQQFPNETYPVIERFSNSENMWLNRSGIIFQLSYKKKTNFDLLKAECEKHKNSNEFFIQKAIGWALRDYSRYNPSGVTEYVNATHLKPLSQREALRNIK